MLKVQTTQKTVPDIYQTCQAWGKEEEKTLIPGPVWYLEKFILAQHCFRPAPAAIGNVP